MESAVRELEKRLYKAKKTDYDSIDKIMRKLCKERDITPTELHNAFKKEHNGKTPDDWIAMYVDESNDPLVELYQLWEAEVMQKPDIQDAMPSSVEGPNKGNYEHPITQRRNEVDSLIGTGMNPVQAHQNVYGEVNTGDIESKAALASTLGRVQDDGNKRAVTIEKEKGSILALDANLEKVLDQVTRDDLRTPMNQQVPDSQQTPANQVAEDLEIADDYDYNEDVAYLQKYGRA